MLRYTHFRRRRHAVLERTTEFELDSIQPSKPELRVLAAAMVCIMKRGEALVPGRRSVHRWQARVERVRAARARRPRRPRQHVAVPAIIAVRRGGHVHVRRVGIGLRAPLAVQCGRAGRVRVDPRRRAIAITVAVEPRVRVGVGVHILPVAPVPRSKVRAPNTDSVHGTDVYTPFPVSFSRSQRPASDASVRCVSSEGTWLTERDAGAR